jgi:radical SAM protein with 4Fe4S-binding SPASM domain
MECPHIPNIQYSEFSMQLHDKAGSSRIPITGSVELTARCNLNCAHCYIRLPADSEEARQNELSLSEWRRIIDEITAEGCLWLFLTGGEPLLRLDFLEIYTYAKEKGLLIILFTNGTLITPRIADHLAEWRPFYVEISIYGATRKTYESVTRVPGSYDRCRRGIHLLLERGIPLNLKTVVMSFNKHELGEMTNWAAELGVPFRFDPLIVPKLDASREPCTLRLTPEEVVALDLADERRSKEWKELRKKFTKSLPEPQYLFFCGAGIGAFHLDFRGELCLCLMVRKPGYHLPSGSFKEGWGNFLVKVRQQKRQNPILCTRCELIPLCGQCPGWAWLENGNPEGKVEYLCQIANLREAAFADTFIKNGEVNHDGQETIPKTRS